MNKVTAIGWIAGMLFVNVAQAANFPELAIKLECNKCHAIEAKVVGPSWQAVAKRYKGAAQFKYSKAGSDAADAEVYPLAKGLALKVAKGGWGNWGKMPMPPNDPTGLKQAEIDQLVRYILGLAK